MKKIIETNSLIKFNITFHHYEEVSPEWILALEEPKPTPSLKDLMPISGFYVDREGEIQELKDHTQHYASELWNILPTKKEAEAYKILPMLLHFRDKYNEGWKPDWTENSMKHIICSDDNRICKDDSFYRAALFSFEFMEVRDQFFEDFREELEIVKPLL